LLLAHVTGEGSNEILGSGRNDDRLGAYAARSQEAQQVLNVVLLAPPGLCSDWSAAAPASAQKLLNTGFAELGRVNIMLVKPAVERCCVQCLDAHHSGDELLPNQQLDEGTEVFRDRTGGAVRDRGGVLE
jgi:hypothetical protein